MLKSNTTIKGRSYESTALFPEYDKLVCIPLLSWQILMIEPKNSSGVIIVDFIQGSSILKFGKDLAYLRIL